MHGLRDHCGGRDPRKRLATSRCNIHFGFTYCIRIGVRILGWGFGSRFTVRGHSGTFLLVVLFGTSIVIDLGLGHSPLTPRMCAASEFSSRSWSVQESFLARAWVSATLKGRLTHKSAHVKAMWPKPISPLNGLIMSAKHTQDSPPMYVAA